MPELFFKGKEFVFNHHHAVPFRPLVPDPKRSIGESGKTGKLDGNLIIHGDNLHALKALLPWYAGKVNCIFIDPPYNTGNEGWCYNDNVNSPMMREWLDSNPVGIEDGLRHDKWLAMMWPRLRLLRELHMATNQARPIAAEAEEIAGCGYLGESSAQHVWLIYRPDLDFLKFRDAALTLARAKAIAEAKPDKSHLVYAPTRFVSKRVLEDAKLPCEVAFAPLPYALYSVERL